MGFTVFLILFVLMGSVSATDDNITSSQDTCNEIAQEKISTGNDDSILNEIENKEILKTNHENTTLKTSVSGDTFADIQTAISSADDGDTIEINGSYKGSGTAILIDKNNLTIVGNGATLDAQGQSRILNITGTGIILKDINFINGNASDRGGAIYWQGTNGIIKNCNFTNNKAKLSGGAVYWNGTSGTINGSNFINNTAAKFSGGAIHLDSDSANGTVNNCNFISNEATQRGGTIFWCGVNGTMSNSNFINSFSMDGGAINWDQNAVNGALNNCSFINNTGNDGGAVYWYGAHGKMNNCNFTNNTGTNGGAINWQRTYGLVSNSNFINNSATNGGAIYWEGTNGTENNSYFTSNKATNGGAVYWYGYNGTINNSKFANSKATQNGGAINWQGTNGTVTACNFTNNAAESNGGAISIASDGTKIDNVNLINSTASKSGGAIYVDAKDTVISNSELSGNSAADGTDNVALGMDGENLLIDNVTSDKGQIVSSVTEINVTGGGDVYQGGSPSVVNIKTNAKKGTVSITVKGKTYKGNVKDGVATISMPDLVAGTYRDVVVSYHDSTGDYGDASGNVTFTVKASKAKIINKNIKKDYNSNYKYNIRIIGVDGKPVNGVKIKISINGKSKSYKTNSKGYIIIKLGKTYIPCKYTVKLSYKGITSKHVITVKQILKAKKVVKIKKNAKKVVLKAKLKSSNGKAIKGKRITFKVKGKTYKAKTDKKGIAKITLKSKVIKKFKAGKTYNVKITYLKDTIKTMLKVKK